MLSPVLRQLSREVVRFKTRWKWWEHWNRLWAKSSVWKLHIFFWRMTSQTLYLLSRGHHVWNRNRKGLWMFTCHLTARYQSTLVRKEFNLKMQLTAEKCKYYFKYNLLITVIFFLDKICYIFSGIFLSLVIGFDIKMQWKCIELMHNLKYIYFS